MDINDTELSLNPEGDVLSPGDTSSKGAQKPSADASQLESLSERLARMEGLVRSLQSGKDKGIDQVRTDVNDLRKQIARITELKAKGLDDNAIAREMQLDALLENQPKLQQSKVPEDNIPGKNVPKASDSVNRVLELAGLSANSPDVIEILRNTADPLEQIDKITTLQAEKKAKDARQVAPTGTPLPSGATGAPANIGDREAQINAELEALLNDPNASRKLIDQKLQELKPFLK